MLSDAERFAFHEALNKMKMTAQYDALAKLHTSSLLYSVYGGPNFLGWHRVYLYLFEEALDRTTPGVTLPYWDSTLDHEIEDPIHSNVWTHRFLGNGDGLVTTGAFANWNVPGGRLTRNIGGNGMLVTKEEIRTILTRCRLGEITVPTALDGLSLEGISSGTHVWIGGQMSNLNTASYDPAFLLHRAFIDYIWEQFRNRQRNCGVNPVTDYPMTIGLHAAELPMVIFPQFRNIDVCSDSWTKNYYRYERSPSCSILKPFCGSPYLDCDLTRRLCVSAAVMLDIEVLDHFVFYSRYRN